MRSGTSARCRSIRHGVTLLELLVVLVILALASAGVVASLPDRAAQRLDEQAERLRAQLDVAQAWAQASAIAVHWRADEGGYRFEGLPGDATDVPPTHRWSDPNLSARSDGPVRLGPEPMGEPFRIELTLGPYRRVLISDGWSGTRIE